MHFFRCADFGPAGGEVTGLGSRDEFVEAIRRKQELLTRSQRRAADYIVRNFDDCAFKTSAEIGEQAGVSETTVFRLAATLDFPGFAAMQKFIRSGLVRHRIERVARPGAGAGDEAALLARVAQADADNVQQTLARLNAADLRRAAELILAAPQVCTIGMRSSTATASYLAAALNQLFGNVTPLPLPIGDSIDRLRGSPPGTVVIGVSFLRYARPTVEAMRYARELGLPTIVITDSVTAPPARFGDVVLLVATASIHFLPSQTAALAVVNALIGAVALRDRARVAAALKRFEDTLIDVDVFWERG